MVCQHKVGEDKLGCTVTGTIVSDVRYKGLECSNLNNGIVSMCHHLLGQRCNAMLANNPATLFHCVYTHTQHRHTIVNTKPVALTARCDRRLVGGSTCCLMWLWNQASKTVAEASPLDGSQVVWRVPAMVAVAAAKGTTDGSMLCSKHW